jgi:N-acetylneuraminate synthase
MSSRADSQIFENLFVLELANNHWGSVDRGLKIIRDFSRIVRFNNVHAAIKLQFRDVDNFIHKDWRDRDDVRYIKKTLDTQLSRTELRTLVDAVRSSGCVTCATPFDEASVEMCVEFGIDVIKIASSDISDWFLVEQIAKTRKPVIFSTGGSSLRTSTTWSRSSSAARSRWRSTTACRSTRARTPSSRSTRSTSSSAATRTTSSATRRTSTPTGPRR